jgi:hypothetical protein
MLRISKYYKKIKIYKNIRYHKILKKITQYCRKSQNITENKKNITEIKKILQKITKYFKKCQNITKSYFKNYKTSPGVRSVELYTIITGRIGVQVDYLKHFIKSANLLVFNYIYRC